MAKTIEREFRGKGGVFSPLFRMTKSAKGLARKDLCALCLLSVQPLVFLVGKCEDKEEGRYESMLIKGFVFCLYPEIISAVSARSAVHFSFTP